MTVTELIERLKKFDPNAPVSITPDCGGHYNCFPDAAITEVGVDGKGKVCIVADDIEEPL